MHTFRGVGRKTALASLVALTMAASACSSTTPKTSSPASSKSGSQTSSNALTDARAAVNAHSTFKAQALAVVQGQAPLTTRPPQGKKIIYVTEPLDAAIQLKVGLSQAANALGWSFSLIQEAGPAPDQVLAAFQQAIAQHPDMIIHVGGDLTGDAQAYAATKAAGIPVAEDAVAGQPTGMSGNGVIGIDNGTQDVTDNGALLATWAYADSNGSRFDAAFVDFAVEPIIATEVRGFSSELHKLCPTCGYKSLQAQFSDIGNGLPNQIVSAVRTNPRLKYIAFPVASAVTGVPAALSTAGLSGNVKLLVAGPDGTTLQGIRDGTIAMSSLQNSVMEGWNLMGIAARYFAHDGPSGEAALPKLPSLVLTKANVTKQFAANINRTMQSQVDSTITDAFKRLWKVT